MPVLVVRVNTEKAIASVMAMVMAKKARYSSKVYKQHSHSAIHFDEGSNENELHQTVQGKSQVYRRPNWRLSSQRRRLSCNHL